MFSRGRNGDGMRSEGKQGFGSYNRMTTGHWPVDFLMVSTFGCANENRPSLNIGCVKYIHMILSCSSNEVKGKSRVWHQRSNKRMTSGFLWMVCTFRRVKTNTKTNSNTKTKTQTMVWHQLSYKRMTSGFCVWSVLLDVWMRTDPCWILVVWNIYILDEWIRTRQI